MAKRKTSRAGRKRGRTAARKKTRAPRPARKKAAARARRRSPETLRLRSITPGLTVGDLQRSLSFYTEVLRFIVGERWTGEAGELHGVMLKAGACDLGVSQDDWKKGRDRKKGEGVRLWLKTVQGVDALAARVKAAGFELTEEPKDQPWGARAFSLDDPDGYHLTIFREPGTK